MIIPFVSVNKTVTMLLQHLRQEATEPVSLNDTVGSVLTSPDFISLLLIQIKAPIPVLLLISHFIPAAKLNFTEEACNLKL